MKIKIVHLSDLEPNPTLQATRDTPPWRALRDKLAYNTNFRRDTWNWLFDSTIDLLDRIRQNKGEDQQLLLISGDVVKGYGTDNNWVMAGWARLYDKLKEIADEGTQIILTTGSHDTHAIEKHYPTAGFYNSKPYNDHEGDLSAPWIVMTNPSGERLDLCDDEISIIGYGDLDGVRGDRNRDAYDVGRLAFSRCKDQLAPRFVIGLSPDHRPGSRQWAEYNIYNYIATGGTEGHDPLDPKRFKEKGNNYFSYSQQGSPYRCVGFDKPLFEQMVLSFTYGVVDTEKRSAAFKDLYSDTPASEFSVDGGYTISYKHEN